MTLLQMQYFNQVCESGSTLKASQKLNVAQTTISTAIKALESELSVSLFERTSKGMIPSEAGKYFLEHSKKILQDVKDLTDDIRDFSIKGKTIRLGIPVILNFIYWADLYFALKTTFPNLEFKVINRTVPVLLEMLEENSLDAVIAVRPQKEEGPYVLLLKESCHNYVSMSVSHPLAKKSSVSYKELLPYPVLGYTGDSLKTKILQKEYAKYGAELTYSQRFDQFSTLIQFLRRNAGIAYITEKSIGAYPDLVNIPIEEDEKKRYPTYLIWTKNSALASMPKGFFQVFKDYFSGLEE